MSIRKFYIRLIATTLLTLVLLSLLFLIPDMDTHIFFSLLALGIFIFLTILVYHIGKKLSSHKNRYLFSHMFLILTISKIFVSILMIVCYDRLGNVENNYFIFPFLLIYLIFTAHETWILIKLSKSSSVAV